ncbi:MAG: 30S ribosomal protein S1 [Candidatus Omnitrophica bacterium]|nr:30S ribosomal protein S1 [Candidatus Omnitrophota bacterium]
MLKESFTATAEGAFMDDELSKLYEESFREIEEGQIVKGRIIGLTETDILVDVGYKSEGSISLEEFDDPSVLKVGDPIEVFLETVEDDEGFIVLSKRKAEKAKGWERLLAMAKEGDLLEGKVTRKVKGGLMVDVGGVEAFLPASQVFLRGFGNLDALVGQTMNVIIIKVHKARKNLVVSRREALLKERESMRHKLLDELEVGQVRQGVVKNITDFGAFISLGGVDGLLHITDMSWGRVNHPSEVVSVGQKLDIMILGFDRETSKISLGLKQLQPNPWEQVEARYPVGTRLKGKVVSLMPYGAFVELEKGLEGLVHISEFSWTKRPSHPSEIVKVGDEVECVILSVDRENQKIALGMKQMEANPWEAYVKEHPVGSRVTGRVQHLTEYGAFVELAEGIEGLLHVQDLSWTRRFNHPFECLKKGQEVEVVILSADPENRKIALSIKSLTPDPWPTIAGRFPTGTSVQGVVTKIAPFGIFVEIEKDLDGLVHLSELPVELPAHLKGRTRRKPQAPASPAAVEAADPQGQAVAAFLETQFKVGDTVQARVLRIDEEQRRIALSLKRA